MKSRKEYLQFAPPFLGEEEVKEVSETLRSGWITTGPKTKQFEEEFSKHVNAPAALALNSCTGALHTALAALGIGEGDEIITTTLTFAATVNVIEQVRARPILVDVESDTLNIDVKKIEKVITKKTKGILPVHFAGHPVDLDSIFEIANRYDLYVIEDAAHAFPAEYKGRKIGSGNNLVAFSFYATKNITTAEGGMLTGKGDLIEKSRIISLHGMSKDAWKRYDKKGSWYYEILYPGFKYNMTDIQASIGLCQLKKVNEMQSKRRNIANKYNQAFRNEDALILPVEKADVVHSWHLYILRLNPEVLTIDRDVFIEELKLRNIGTSVHFIPIHLHPFYKNKYGYKYDDFPVAYSSYQRMLSLPIHPSMTDQDADDVIEAVKYIVKKYKK